MTENDKCAGSSKRIVVWDKGAAAENNLREKAALLEKYGQTGCYPAELGS